MAFYQETKSMKGAVIGTIMPWTGGLSDIPAGWIICNGTEVEANLYPLLTQAIGDTYRQSGNSNLTGGFPFYDGNSTITLPNLTDGRTLMDVESDYFAGGSSPKDSPIEQDTDAGNLVIPFIGDNRDNNDIPTVFAGDKALKTDVEFDLPVSDRTGYGGNIRGNTIIDGIGEKIMYIGGRKLGHQHIRSHSHPGSYETISAASNNKPGGGVVPWDFIRMKWAYRIWNVTGEGDHSSAGGADGMRAIFRWYYADTNIELIDSGSVSAFNNISGWNNGPAGRSMGSGNVENPTINLSAQGLNARPFCNLNQWQHEYLNGGTEITMGQQGRELEVSDGYTNYYLSDGGNASYGTLTSNTLYEWTPFSGDPGTDSRSVVAHGHDPFIVEYDQGTLKPNTRIIANAEIPLATTLDNAINKSALEIQMNTSQPSLTCIYLIRAY